MDTKLKGKPGLLVVGITEGQLRMMGLGEGVDVGTEEEATGAGFWALLPTKAGNGGLTAGEEDGDTMDGMTEVGGAGNCAGGELGGIPELGTAGGFEHEAVTVAVESIKTVWTPSVPVAVKMDAPPCTAGFAVGGDVGTGDGDVVVVVVGVENEGGVDAGVLGGTVPLEGNVLAEDVEKNWRLFSLRTGGELADALSWMI